MDTLSTKLDKITDSRKLSYVLERAETNSATEACKNAGISRPLYYKWGKEQRDYLDGLALELKRETGLRAKLILSGATKEAAEIKVAGMKSRNEHIKQSASSEILDRMLGKPMQPTKVDVKSDGKLTIEYINDWRHYSPDTASGSEDSTPTGEEV